MIKTDLKLNVQILLITNFFVDLINKFVKNLNSSNFSSFENSTNNEYTKKMLNVIKHIDQLRNFMISRSIFKTFVNFDIIFEFFKHRSKLFRQKIRINFFTFDRLMKRLQHQFVFQNDNHQQQIFVKRQIFIIFKRFEIYDNNNNLQTIAH